MSWHTRVAPACLLLSASFAFADPVTVTIQTVGNVINNGVTYTNQQISLVGVGDTSHLITTDAPVDRLPVSATVTIGSLGTFLFTDPIDVFTNTNLVGFEDESTTDPFAYFTSPALSGNALLGSISVTGLQSGSIAYPLPETTGGTFLLATSDPAATLSVVVTPSAVPEPASLALVATGLAGVGTLRRTLRRT